MAIRNFWVEADIDGRQTTLAGGPLSKHGGLTLHLYQRDNGEISGVVTIVCRESAGSSILR